MSSRPESATIQLKVRMKESLRRQIDSSARARGISLNADVVKRLEESFLPAERLFDEPILTVVAQLVGASFATGGQLAARRLGHPEWKADEWMQDPSAFRSALTAAFAALAGLAPDESKPNLDEIERLAEAAANIIANDREEEGAGNE